MPRMHCASSPAPRPASLVLGLGLLPGILVPTVKLGLYAGQCNGPYKGKDLRAVRVAPVGFYCEKKQSVGDSLIEVVLMLTLLRNLYWFFTRHLSRELTKIPFTMYLELSVLVRCFSNRGLFCVPNSSCCLVSYVFSTSDLLRLCIL